MGRILLIVPCFNESRRLDLAAFENGLSTNIDIFFANDGSGDNTQSIVDQAARNNSRFRVFHAEKNVGKGEVIRLAYQSGRAQGWLDGYEWIGFWDADLATPLAEVNRFLEYRELFSPPATSLFGSRVARMGANIKRSKRRHYLSRIFVTLVDLVLQIRAYDSQCGAKLFSKSAAALAFAEPFTSRWIFDLEIILRLRGQGIVEVPLQSWQDVPDNKLKVSREVGRVLLDLWQLRQRYGPLATTSSRNGSLKF